MLLRTTHPLVRYLYDDQYWYRVEFRYLEDKDYNNRDENNELLPRRKWKIIAHDILYPKSYWYTTDQSWWYKDGEGNSIIPCRKIRLSNKDVEDLKLKEFFI